MMPRTNSAAIRKSPTEAATCRAMRFERPRHRGSAAAGVSLASAVRTLADFVSCSAGSRLETMSASSAATATATSTAGSRRASTRSSAHSPNDASIAASTDAISPCASRIASSAPPHAMTLPSTSCSRMSCQREAPMARRTAISCRRETPRDSTRFATLVQAMRRTSTGSASTSRPTSPSVGDRPAVNAGATQTRRAWFRRVSRRDSASSRAPITASSASAVAVDTPERRRATTFSARKSRAAVSRDTSKPTRGSVATGIQTSAGRARRCQRLASAGITPTTSYGRPPIRTTVPTTPASPLNCARQTDSERSATAGAFGRSSDARSVRPAIARRPSTWK